MALRVTSVLEPVESRATQAVTRFVAPPSLARRPRLAEADAWTTRPEKQGTAPEVSAAERSGSSSKPPRAPTESPDRRARRASASAEALNTPILCSSAHDASASNAVAPRGARETASRLSEPPLRTRGASSSREAERWRSSALAVARATSLVPYPEVSSGSSRYAFQRARRPIASITSPTPAASGRGEETLSVRQ